jgi:hypothetical protein
MFQPSSSDEKVPTGGSPPSERPELRSLLVIDPDTAFLNHLRVDPAFELIRPELAQSAAQGEVVLQDPSARYRAIFVSTEVVGPTVIPMIRRVHSEHPATPIFLLYRGQAPLADVEAERLAIHGTIEKGPPGQPLGLIELIRRIHPSGELPALVPPKKARKPMPARSVAHAPTEEDKGFIPVRAEEFLHGLPSFFDVHIRVPSGKYLKILNAKEAIEPERVLNFIELGVRELYLAKASHARCLSYCDQLAYALIHTGAVSAEMKLMRLVDQGAELLRQLRMSNDGKAEFEMSDHHLDFAATFLGDLFEFTRTIDREETVGAFLKNGPALEHGCATAIASALLSLPLGIGNAKVFQQLGIAALLHDIGLGSANEDEMEMSAQELLVYRQHPEKGAVMLSRIDGIPAIAVQAVAMHHERRAGQGFPGQVSGNEIPVFAQIVGFADEFVRLLRKRNRDAACAGSAGASSTKMNLIRLLELRVLPGFSPQLGQAFRNVFSKQVSRLSGDGAGGSGRAGEGGKSRQ